MNKSSMKAGARTHPKTQRQHMFKKSWAALPHNTSFSGAWRSQQGVQQGLFAE